MDNKKIKPFKVSQLPEIDHIDEKDVLMISDFEGGKFYTKKMTTDHFMGYIGENDKVAGKIAQNSKIIAKIDERILYDAKKGTLKPIISSDVVYEISAQATKPTGVIKPIISSAVETQLSTALSILDGGSAFD